MSKGNESIIRGYLFCVACPDGQIFEGVAYDEALEGGWSDTPPDKDEIEAAQPEPIQTGDEALLEALDIAEKQISTLKELRDTNEAEIEKLREEYGAQAAEKAEIEKSLKAAETTITKLGKAAKK